MTTVLEFIAALGSGVMPGWREQYVKIDLSVEAR
jgi:hypothetical protein